MEQRLINLAIILRTLKIYKMATDSDINFIMNRMFMAEDIGIPIGYKFVWNDTQPFSEELYKDCYKIFTLDKEYITEQIGRGRMKAQYYVLALRLNLLFEQCPYEFSAKRWHGLLVCIRCLQLLGADTDEELIKDVRGLNSHFIKSDILLAKRVYEIMLEPLAVPVTQE